MYLQILVVQIYFLSQLYKIYKTNASMLENIGKI